MNRIKEIRERLGVTQAELAAALGKSQGNVAFYEKGQTVLPEVAKSLICYASTRGLHISYEDIYGVAGIAAAAPVAEQPAQGVANAGSMDTFPSH